MDPFPMTAARHSRTQNINNNANSLENYPIHYRSTELDPMQNNYPNNVGYYGTQGANFNYNPGGSTPQQGYTMNSYNPMPPIAQDLAPRMVSYANDVDYYSKKEHNRHMVPAGHSATSIQIGQGALTAL